MRSRFFGNHKAMGVMMSQFSFARYFALAAVLGLCVFATSAARASAETSHPFLSSFDGSGTPAGSLGYAGPMAVDQATGDVYVADLANQVVDRFSATGAYKCQITGNVLPALSECNGSTGSATPAGSFSFPSLQEEGTVALAVDNSTNPSDPSAGDLYVLDGGGEGAGVIDKFGPTGEYLGEVTGAFSAGVPDGLGVDGEGRLWVFAVLNTGEGREGRVYELAPDGTPVFEFQTGAGSVPLFAVDSNDNTYGLSAETEEFDRSGHKVGVLDKCAFCATAVATDLSTDSVYIDDQGYVLEYGSAANFLAKFGQAELVSGGPGGVAVNAGTGHIYVSNAADGKVYVYGSPGPRVMTLAASNVQTTTATVNATVNPEGAATNYQFEYGTSTSYGHTLPAPPTDLGAGSTSVPVSAALTGLEGGTTYHYRVSATDTNGNTTRSADRTFTTLPVPLIDDATATNLTANSADLHARIDPSGSDTTYRFEYGETIAYGTTPPASQGGEGTILNSDGVTIVSAHIEDLHPNTPYHWRITATNANGPAGHIVDHTFVYETAGGGLPDHRAYEMVTPPQKNGAAIGVILFGLQLEVSETGNQLMVSNIQCFGEVGSCNAARENEGVPYLFTRSANGWGTTALAPPASEFKNNTPQMVDVESGMALFGIPTLPAGEDDFYVRATDGSFANVGPVTAPVFGALGPGPGGLIAATNDFSHVIYQIFRVNAGIDGRFWPGDETTGQTSTYEYRGTGNTSPILVGVSGGAGSTDLISTCGTEVAANSFRVKPGALSSDGRTVYFTAIGHEGCTGSGTNAATPVPADALYARIDESRTVPISQPSPGDCTTAACLGSPPAAAQFEGASADGTKAIFTSTQQLTNDAGPNGNNLYLYDFANPAGHKLIDVSAGDANGARVQGVVAIAPDGSHVYFVANGVLTKTANAQGQTAESSADNLYVFARSAGDPQGHVSFIATLPGSDSKEWAEFALPANVTPDGRFLVFTSHGALTPDDTRLDGSEQVFRYDALTQQLLRISTGADGYNDNGNAGVGDASIVGARADGFRTGAARTDPTMSHDGSYIFFRSPIALTRQALDDVRIAGASTTQYAQNVYEWHEGQVSLISDGRDTAGILEGDKSDVLLLGSDATGANVFFTTADPLVAQDTDTQWDYYDARICTASDPCVAPPASSLPPCLGEACHGIPAATPSLLTPGSSSFNGSGNITPTPAAKLRSKSARCKKGFVKKGKCVKKPKAKKKKTKAKRAGHKRRAKR
jgi:hypothetical protein